MTGTASQIQWAEQIRPRVDAEFERVANAFHSVAMRQKDGQREDTLTVIAILEEKRASVMANSHAGYFIRDWQELTDQVRQMIATDARYRAIQAGRAERRHTFIERSGI